ncbi:MAG: apolipoprotein N-acyltransferase, partial [Bacteroidales bacterium]|nr:apolipoprotein N-acyltransferase [Bacteroidales bacterium]
LSGLLFAIAWPAGGFPGFLFVAFVPLFFIEDHIYKNKSKFSKFSVFFYSFPGFFIFNLLTSWWIVNSTPFGSFAWFLNAFLMALVFNVFHITKRNLFKPQQAYYILIFYWISFELFHLHWELSWPWMTLGNGFASFTKWVQWYEFTGVFGGTLWIILVNILLYKLLILIKEKTKNTREIIYRSLFVAALIFIPIIISLIIYHNYDEKENAVEVVVVQPNFDPYTEQYELPPSKMIGEILNMAESRLDNNTDFIVTPESADQENIWEGSINNYRTIKQIKNFVREYPQTSIIVGASTYKMKPKEDPITNAARKFREIDKYYYAHNAAMYFDTSDIIQFYHKSKLTAGVEMMPSWSFLRPLEKFAIDLGGTVGTLKTDAVRRPFISKDSLKVGTIICYESVYGEFVTEFVKNGAELIFIITNDGWWGNTPGHKQHFVYSKLRAIETRRSIARSANTGISCFINQKGDVFQQTEYWKPAVIKQSINKNAEYTFYVKYGDYIGRISAYIAALFFLITIMMGIINRKKL